MAAYTHAVAAWLPLTLTGPPPLCFAAPLLQVLAIPEDMRPGGKGPLLSAYKYDADMLWSRVSQIHSVSQVRLLAQEEGRLTVADCG